MVVGMKVLVSRPISRGLHGGWARTVRYGRYLIFSHVSNVNRTGYLRKEVIDGGNLHCFDFHEPPRTALSHDPNGINTAELVVVPG